MDDEIEKALWAFANRFCECTAEEIIALRRLCAFVARSQRASDIDQIRDQIVGVVRWPLVISGETGDGRAG